MKTTLTHLAFLLLFSYSGAQTIKLDTIQARPNCAYFLIETPEATKTILEFKTNDYSRGIGPEITDLRNKKTIKLSARENLQGGFCDGIVTSEDPDGQSPGRLSIYQYKNGNVVKQKVLEGEDYYCVEFINDDYMLVSNRMDLSISSLQLYQIKKNKFINIQLPSPVYESVLVSFNETENVFAIGGMVKGGYPENNDVFVVSTEGIPGIQSSIRKNEGGMSNIYCIQKDQVLVSIYDEQFLVDTRERGRAIGQTDSKLFFGAMVTPNHLLCYSAPNDKGGRTTQLLTISSDEINTMPSETDFEFENLIIANYSSFEGKAYAMDKKSGIVFRNGIPLNIQIGANPEFFKRLFSSKYNLLISKYHNYVCIIQFSKN